MATTTADLNPADPPAEATVEATAPDVTPTRVVMLAAISGTRDGLPWPAPGEEVTVPAFEAASLIHNQLARPAPEPVERAVVEEPSERAVVEDKPTSRAQSARPGRTGRSKGKT